MICYTIQKNILMERSLLFDLLDQHPITFKIKHGKNKAIKNKNLVDVDIYYTVNHKTSSNLKSLIVSGSELSSEIRAIINKSNNIKMKWFIEWIDKCKSKNQSIPSNILDIYNIIFNIDESFNLRNN